MCVDAALSRIYSVMVMNEPIHSLDDLSALENRVDELLSLLRKLHDENRSLRTSQEQLVTERANLVAKNEQARSRVEAMINRLKSLEQGS